jgi:biotin synthase
MKELKMTTDWSYEKASYLYSLPFNDLLYQAHTIHRHNFEPNTIQISTLISIKTGSCPENCSYCPQSAHYNTDVEKKSLLDLEEVRKVATRAKESGATRFCMGAAWRGPRDNDLEQVCEMIEMVNDMGMETCVTLGLLKPHQVGRLKEAGLDYYNHNLDTSEEYYDKIITTRTFKDRLDTIDLVRESGIKVCCGGILGMGETTDDRLRMLVTLANMSEAPESVPINQLMPVPGTPLGDNETLDPFEFIRIIAVARIMMPKSYVRLSAGRSNMSDEMQAMCFFAGANSIFYGEEVLLTTPNPTADNDDPLFQRLGLTKLQTPPAKEICDSVAENISYAASSIDDQRAHQACNHS